ncbi:MAG: type II toxin-antitoxin system prevent-host-death family antitoxin [Dehalococcoidia bacterium]|nr:type II toxin-antitoxin system prevent-host-death family antitoxin [Dehalococcoidia bacterium]
MKTVSVAEFGRDWESLVAEIEDEIVIVRDGKPIARVLPPPPESGNLSDLYGKYRDKIKVRGDIMSTGLEWDAQR